MWRPKQSTKEQHNVYIYIYINCSTLAIKSCAMPQHQGNSKPYQRLKHLYTKGVCTTQYKLQEKRTQTIQRPNAFQNPKIFESFIPKTFNLHPKAIKEGFCTLLHPKPVNKIFQTFLIPKAFKPFITNIFNLDRKSFKEGLCTFLYPKPINKIFKALLIPKAFGAFIPNTFNLHRKSFEEGFCTLLHPQPLVK